MVVTGNVLLPSKLKLKAEFAELTFMPDARPSYYGQEQEHRPLGVGYLDVRDRRLRRGFTMASDALDSVMRMLLAGRFQSLVFDGEAMRFS